MEKAAVFGTLVLAIVFMPAVPQPYSNVFPLLLLIIVAGVIMFAYALGHVMEKHDPD